MATHAETMQLGQEVLLNGVASGYTLEHLETCSRNADLTMSACSCGLDAAWTASVLQAADMVTTFGVVQGT